MEKKRKWERDYESYANSTELDERIEYLTDLTNGKVALKEEYAELKRLTAIKENLPKVKNILELREQLDAQRKEIETEIQKRERFEKLKKVETILEEQMKKLELEYANLGSKMKNADLKPEEKAEIKSKMQANEKAREENNIKFGKCHERMREYQEQEKFKRMTIDDMKMECTQISMNISKCNLACNKLMKGYSWQSVEVALDKYEAEKLTAKGGNAKKMQQNRVAAKATNGKEDKSKSDNTKAETKKVETEKSEPAKVEKTMEESKEENEEKSLEVPTRWIKIKGWAKNLFEKWFVEEVDEEKVKAEKEQNKSSKKKSIFTRLKNAYNAFIGKEETSNKESDKTEQKNNEQTKSNEETTTKATELAKEEKTETKQDAFRQYLKDVAEKGIDGVEQEKAESEKADKAAKRQAAIEKLKANRAGKDTGATITNLDKEIQGQDR